MYEFNTQPNMIFKLKKEWVTNDDYVAAFSKRYRDQYKRAHKKFEGIETRELLLDDIIQLEIRIYELYYHVAKNAPFNTFFLAKNHFSSFKKQCGERFIVIGYYNWKTYWLASTPYCSTAQLLKHTSSAMTSKSKRKKCCT